MLQLFCSEMSCTYDYVRLSEGTHLDLGIGETLVLVGAPRTPQSLSWLQDGSVSPAPFLPDQIQKQDDGIPLPLKIMGHCLSTGANASPATREASLAEQVRLNGHGVEARHVLFGVGAFDVKSIVLSDHPGRITYSRHRVQRLF